MKNFFFFLSAFSLVMAEVPEGANEEQAEKWLEMEYFVNHVTDGLGMPIDEGIKELVLVLNLLDIETRQSCEGHGKERARTFPWVALVCPGLSELIIEKNKLADEYMKIRSEEAGVSIYFNRFERKKTAQRRCEPFRRTGPADAYATIFRIRDGRGFFFKNQSKKWNATCCSRFH